MPDYLLLCFTSKCTLVFVRILSVQKESDSSLLSFTIKVFPVAIFLCTAVALGEINSLDSEEKDIINGDYDVDGFPYDLDGSNDAPDTPDLVKVSLAVASVLLVVSVIVAGYHLLLLLQHLLGVHIDGFVIFLISVSLERHNQHSTL